MANVYLDSCGHYATAQVTRKWTGTYPGDYPLDVHATMGRCGRRCLQATVGSRSVMRTLAAHATWTVGFAVYSTGLPDLFPIHLCKLLDVGVQQVDLRWQADGTLQVTRNGTALGNSGAFALGVNVWYYIEFKATVDNSAGVIEVRVDGTARIGPTSSLDTQATANATANGFALGCVSTSSVGPAGGLGANLGVFYSDIYVNDGSGSSPNNTFWGDTRVDAHFPSGAGTYAAWTPSAGANYAAVDEVAPTDDADYVASTTPGNKDAYAFGDTAVASVRSVQILGAVRKTDALTRTSRILTRSGGTDYGSTDFAPGTSFHYDRVVRETDPATGMAWTPSGFNAAEFGVEDRS